MSTDSRVDSTAAGKAGGTADLSPVIYVVDDERLVRSYLSRLLAASGYQAVVFASADEVLQHDLSPAPGCVLLDLFLPGQGGLEIQRVLSERAGHLPIIFCDQMIERPHQQRGIKFLFRHFAEIACIGYNKSYPLLQPFRRDAFPALLNQRG